MTGPLPCDGDFLLSNTLCGALASNILTTPSSAVKSFRHWTRSSHRMMRHRNSAPADEINTNGLVGSHVPLSGIMTPSSPEAAALRNIMPTFRGVVIPSRARNTRREQRNDNDDDDCDEELVSCEWNRRSRASLSCSGVADSGGGQKIKLSAHTSAAMPWFNRRFLVIRSIISRGFR